MPFPSIINSMEVAPFCLSPVAKNIKGKERSLLTSKLYAIVVTVM
jgi:hypothetical protein